MKSGETKEAENKERKILQKVWGPLKNKKEDLEIEAMKASVRMNQEKICQVNMKKKIYILQPRKKNG